MTSFRSRIFAASIVALALLTASPSDADPIGPTRGEISGTAFNVDPDLFNNSYVSADRVGASPDKKRYDVDYLDGRYAMDDLLPGDYRVRFHDTEGTRAWEWYPGTRDMSKATVFRVRAGKSIKNVDFSLEEGGHIAGQINLPGSTDYAAANAYVTAYYLDGDTWKPVPSEAAVSSIRGGPSFRIGGLATGTYRLRWESSEGFRGTSSDFLGGTSDAATATPVHVVAGETQAVDFTPRMGGVLRGRVVDADGQPVPGADVFAAKPRPNEPTTWMYWDRDIETDVDGRYEIPRLDSGDYAVLIRPREPFQSVWSGGAVKDFTKPSAKSDGPPPDVTLVHVEAAHTTTWQDEVVQRGGTLEGTVRDQNGLPVEGMEVVARTGGGYIFDEITYFDGPRLTRTTDAEGHYSFGELVRRPYKLEFRDPSGAYSNPDYRTWEYSGGDPARWFDGVIVNAGERRVIDIQAYAYPPGVSDSSPVVGQSLKADLRVAGTSLASDPSAVWRWERDGEPIPGADGPSYRTTPTDRGARLTTTVTSPRNGRPVLHTSRATSAVAVSRPSLKVSASSSRKGRVTLTVKASSSGLSADVLDGRISVGRVRSGRDHLTTRTMSDGSLAVTLTGQPKGRRTYSVQFLAAADRYKASSTVKKKVVVR